MNDKELLERLLLRIDLLCHDKQYRFRNKDGTWYSREACKDLTNEELVRELDAEFNNLNETLNDYEDIVNSVPRITSKITNALFDAKLFNAVCKKEKKDAKI